jgi:branched-chain amino acid transport system substrate-binding protein
VEALFGYAGRTKIAADCARQGYKPLYILSQGAINGAYRQDPNFDGALGDLGTFPWFIDNSPATHAFRTALSQYWPNFDSFLSPYTATATWAALELFRAAAANVGDSPTPADITAGIYALPAGFTLGGLIPPETLTQGKANSNPCFFVVGIKSQQYTQPYGDKAYCQTPLPSASS